MPVIHFLNVLEGDCNIIQHDSGRLSVMDVSNAYNNFDTPEEIAAKASQERKDRLNRTQVPSNKKDYRQKNYPDNPIDYLKNNIGVENIFRFIVSHPDMDHIDGIKDLYTEFGVSCSWVIPNNKYLDLNTPFAGYNKEDWKFYKELRDRKYKPDDSRAYLDSDQYQWYVQDNIKILAPNAALVKQANDYGDYHDMSYVLLLTVPKKDGGTWKIIFGGDSHDSTWEYILDNYKEEVSNIDVLFAPHHGRGSKRSYDFLKVLNPRLTLFGNASSEHLAYDCYQPIRITNNQAGYIILDIEAEALNVYVKHYDFARDFKARRNWSVPAYSAKHKAYSLFQFSK